MRKQLFIFVFAMLLVPFMQACSDDEGSGADDEYKDGLLIVPISRFLTVDNTTIDFGPLAVGDKRSFAFTIKSVYDKRQFMSYAVMINDNDQYDTVDKIVTDDCGGREENSFLFDPTQICTVQVSFTAREPKVSSVAPVSNEITIGTYDNVSMIISREMIIPIKYTIK